jgi:hypothetical protein
MQRRQLIVRWALGAGCVLVEVTLVVLIVTACSRHFADEFFLWHPILMSIGALLCLSHGSLPPTPSPSSPTLARVTLSLTPAYAAVRVYNALPGLSRWKARAVHGTLSTLWVILSVAGLVVVEQHKLSRDVPLFTTYVVTLSATGRAWSHLARV